MDGISMIYSRDKQCNYSNGGASKVYVMPFENYFNSQVTVSENVLTNFPYNIIFDMNAFNITASCDGKDGYFDESVSFQVKKTSEKDLFNGFINQDYRVIIVDNNKKIRLYGLRNGMIGSYKDEIGTNRQDFNGYNFTFTNKEEYSAPYLTDLSFFNIMPVDGLILQDGNDNAVQDGNENIITN